MQTSSRRPRVEADHALGERFVTLVRALPQARQVLLEAAAEGARIWTVIEAEPFDRGQREPVYAAEIEALQAHPDVVADFRLINLTEYGESRAADVLPENAEVLWHR
jgi:hypothetical protein